MTHPKLYSDILLPPNDKQLIYTTNAVGFALAAQLHIRGRMEFFDQSWTTDDGKLLSIACFCCDARGLIVHDDFGKAPITTPG